MSLWQQYQKQRQEALLIEDVPSSMSTSLYSWLYEVAKYRLSDPYQVAVEIRNKFRIGASIPSTRANSYGVAEPEFRFAQFLLNLGWSDPLLFFTVLDYLVQTYLTRDDRPVRLEKVLADAGHKYAVIETGGKYVLAERLPEEHKRLMDGLLQGTSVYSSEFYDAFLKIYGTTPNYTEGAGEAFQALESALKHWLGDDTGQNLGAIVAWMRNNPKKWTYEEPAEGQRDAEVHFVETADFVNQSYRAVKHGHADKKLTVSREQAEAMLRAVSLLIYELEHRIKVIEAKQQAARKLINERTHEVVKSFVGLA